MSQPTTTTRKGRAPRSTFPAQRLQDEASNVRMNKIIPAELDHVEELASQVRKADIDEIAAATGMNPITALLMSFSLSTEVYTWMCGDEVAAVFGVAPDPDHFGVGCPWMIGSDLFVRERTFVLKHSRKIIEHFNQRYPLLENYVHPSNTASVRWLRWCGFQFDEAEPYGPRGDLFIPFFRELEQCA